MQLQFQIYVSCTDAARPPISYKIREYFERFITDNILEKKRIIIGGKWKIILAMIFLSEGKKYTSRNIFMAKGGPRTVKAEMSKLYELIIPLKVVQESANPLLKTIELMYESIKIFLTSTYKKVTPELMDELWKEVDMDYLLSLPYPAPLPEQKYVGDIIKPNGEIEILQFQ